MIGTKGIQKTIDHHGENLAGHVGTMALVSVVALAVAVVALVVAVKK